MLSHVTCSKPLEVHDLFIHAESLFASKPVLLIIRWRGY